MPHINSLQKCKLSFSCVASVGTEKPNTLLYSTGTSASTTYSNINPNPVWLFRVKRHFLSGGSVCPRGIM
jgi:hypothetical protein